MGIATRLKKARKELSLLHTELNRYDNILKNFRNAIPSEYDFLFAKYQIYLKKPFFDHLGQLILAAWKRGEEKETEILQTIATKIFMLVEVYTKVQKNRDKMHDAVTRLH